MTAMTSPMAADFPAYVVAPGIYAWENAYELKPRQKSVDNNVLDQFLLGFVPKILPMLEDAPRHIVRMKIEDARQFMGQISGLDGVFELIRTDINKGIGDDASEVEKIMFQLGIALLRVHAAAAAAADDSPVDEASDDYKAFETRMIEHSISNHEVIHGKDALFALFEN